MPLILPSLPEAVQNTSRLQIHDGVAGVHSNCEFYRLT